MQFRLRAPDFGNLVLENEPVAEAGLSLVAPRQLDRQVFELLVRVLVEDDAVAVVAVEVEEPEHCALSKAEKLSI